MGEGDKGLNPVETPVNPYSLLEAVNAASETVNRGWLFFLALMAYVLITVAGVTHKDLLLDAPVVLPALQASIPLKNFFTVAPVVVLLFHLGIVAQLVLLARKALEFDKAVRGIEPSDKRTHALRLELSNFFFVQAIAGPERSRVISGFLHGMSWLTTMILPVLLLLFIQVAFLPFHDQGVTFVHRIVLLLDFLVLFLMGTFLMSTETTFFSAMTNNARRHPFNVAVTTLVILFIGFLSFFVATVPGEKLDKTAQMLFGAPGLGAEEPPGDSKKKPTHSRLFDMFERNLEVSDADLVPEKEFADGEASINLRGRDLRYARLRRSDLRHADLRSSDLTHASFAFTDLRGAKLSCNTITNAQSLSVMRENGCVLAGRTDFSGARLDGAQLSGILAPKADFNFSSLEGADFWNANLFMASFFRANLDGAIFGNIDLNGLGAKLQGAVFDKVSLRGAQLSGVDLLGATLHLADLQGAYLNDAILVGANLKGAKLDGASLVDTDLYGTDLSGASIAGTDFRGARIWQTSPPVTDFVHLSLLGDLEIAAPGQSDVDELKRKFRDGETGTRTTYMPRKTIEVLASRPDFATWADGTEGISWKTRLGTTGVIDDAFRRRLSDQLAKLMCSYSGEKTPVATGIVDRATAKDFNGDVRVIHERAERDDCKGAKGVPKDVMRKLEEAVAAKKASEPPSAAHFTPSAAAAPPATPDVTTQPAPQTTPLMSFPITPPPAAP